MLCLFYVIRSYIYCAGAFCILLICFAAPAAHSGGRLVPRLPWSRAYSAFLTAQKKFMEALRGNFATRISRRFGLNFCEQFVNRIFPPDEFLAAEEKTRMVNPIKWLKSHGQRRSRYRDLPLLERYPIGSLERLAGLLILSLTL